MQEEKQRRFSFFKQIIFSVYKDCKRNFKVTLHCTDCNAWFTTLPLSFVWSRIKYISSVIIWKTDYFQLGFFLKLTGAFLLQENKLKLLEWNNFKSCNKKISITLLIRNKFQMYRCETSKAIFCTEVKLKLRLTVSFI